MTAETRWPRTPATSGAYDLTSSMREILAAHASSRPQHTALVCGAKRLSYEELHAITDLLAAFLRARGVGVEDLVGLCAENSIEMIVGMFGILKAGAAYVPLDPEDPRGRLERLITSSGVKILLTQEHLLGHLPDTGIERVPLDGGWARTEGLAALEELTPCPPQRVAYLIHTSGSTGDPKAVQISWSSLLNHVQSFRELSCLSADDRSMLFSSFAFDGSVEEIFAPLLTGATLVIHTERPVPLATLNALIDEHRLTMLDFTVGYWNVWLAFLSAQKARIPASIRRVVIGGELIRSTQLAEWDELMRDQEIDLIITYGPTEATVIATGMVYRRSAAQAGIGHHDGFIGRPLANISVYVLDHDLAPVPGGATGEIYIAGLGLARGYLGAPGLTAEKFIPDPHPNRPGERMYRTGDLGRFLEDGGIQFLGRSDNQVKIRGFRVELGEIERALCSYPGVQSAVAIAVPASDGTKLLGAFVLAAGGQDVEARALGDFVREKLPGFMVPDRIDVLQSFPVKVNGKTDTAALMEMFAARGACGDNPEDGAAAEPEDPQVTEMRQLFASVLGRASVGADENFFKAGGHSLLVLQLLSRLRISGGINVPMKDFFRAPTPAGLAKVVSSTAVGASGSPPIARGRRLTSAMATEAKPAASTAKGDQ